MSPIDFRTYRDPGVFVEAIAPPVVGIPGISPTVLALLGPSPGFNRATESLVLTGTMANDELQTITVVADDGFFTLTFDGQTTDVIAFDAAAGDVEAALEALINVGSGNVSVSGDPAGPWVVEFTDDLGLFDQPLLLGDDSQLVNGTVLIEETLPGQPATSLQSLGVDISTIKVADRSTGVPYASGAIGTLVISVNDTETNFSISQAWPPPLAPFDILVDSEVMTVTAQTGSVFTVDRAQSGTNAQSHSGGQVVNLVDPYANSLVGSVTTRINTASTILTVTEVDTPPSEPFFIEVDGERMTVTERTGTGPFTYTVVRAVGGTTAQSHGIGASVYTAEGADYAVSLLPGDDEVLGTSDDMVVIGRIAGSRISDGGFVSVSFNATNPKYFDASLFDDMDNVRDKYGNPFNTDGTLNSALSLGALLAFNNGATQVVLVAVQPTGTAGSIQDSDWSDALAKLENEPTIDVVVPLSGDSSTSGPMALTKTHVLGMSFQGLPRRAMFGRDGWSTTLTATDFINQAVALEESRVAVVAPGKFEIDNGTATPFKAPGYFAAAAVAGRAAGQAAQEPLTRKTIFGLLDIPEPDTNSNLLAMQQKGVLVLAQDRNGRILVRHGLTTDMTSVYTREISIIAARDTLRQFITDAVESGNLIGSVLDEHATSLAVSIVEAALDQAVQSELIANYTDVKFRTPVDDPTALEIRFAYQPSFPLNYILVQFSIDTTSGTVEFQSINEGGGELAL